MSKKRDFAVAAMAAGITLACVSLADETRAVLDSTAWKWEDIAARDTDVGQYRHVTRQPTRTLEELEMHITTLKPRTSSHAPHTHPNEEMVIVREGTLQAHVNGREIVVGPGTESDVVDRARAFVESLGKRPIVVRDSPGFATSRLGLTLGLEAMRMMEEGSPPPRTST